MFYFCLVAMFGCLFLTLATIGVGRLHSKPTFFSQFRFFLQPLGENECPKIRIIFASESNVIHKLIHISAVCDTVVTCGTELNDGVTELHSLIEGLLL